MLVLKITAASLIVIVAAGNVIKEETRCGYDACPVPKKGLLNVHMVPHTHDDVGWLKTVDQYYYGSHSKIQLAGVQYILDSVIQELLHDPNKRFIYVETAFFWKWWMKQHDSLRHKVKKLVKSGRLEFVGGGWAMHDEAVTHYQSIIDQMTWGFRKLNDTFGTCGRPRAGWQIDPFGHSSESASIMARLGFDGLFFGRLDFQDKMKRLSNKTAELIWESSKNLGPTSDLFTSVLYNHYSAPSGFCFDVLCKDEPINDDIHSPDYNADKKANEFILKMEMQAMFYKGENIIITMGDDFNYQAAHINFANMDRLIAAVNAQQANGSRVNLFYSTPTCYLKALNDENIQFQTKSDDFFPYSSDPHSFWSGYYTSRPTIKYFERIGNNFLQVCKQLYTIANLDPIDRVNINVMREAMGIMQHHDAVTGTEKQAVAFDYARILYDGFSECGLITDLALTKIMTNQTSRSDTKTNTLKDSELKFITCMLLNISACDVSESSTRFVITLYNPLSRSVTHYVRVPIKENLSYTVRDARGTNITTQIVPIPDSVLEIPGRISQAKYELIFLAKSLPPLGYRSYYIERTGELENEIVEETNFEYTIGFKKGGVITVDNTNNIIKSIQLSENITVDQHFWYYTSYAGNNDEFRNRSSGAYIFRPYGQPIMVNPQPKIKGYKGPLVEELHLTFNEWSSQVIRVYKGANNMEFNWLVGPIPVEDNVGREIVSRYNVNILSNKTFYTDSNGREMVERIRDYRPTYKLNLEEEQAGNYYPVTTRAMMKDETNQFSVVTDRAQGAASLKDGQLELMLHRRILHDDAFGVSEALNEEAFGTGLVARGTHYITLGNPSDQSLEDRLLVQKKVLSPWMFFSVTTKSFDEWKKANNMEFSALKSGLSDCVQILTLEPWKGSTFLLRLEHISEKEDSTRCNKTVTVSVQDLFKPFEISSIKETNLGSNQWIEEVSRLVWKKDSNEADDNESPIFNIVNDIPNIALKPMEIRTFVIEVVNNL